MAKEGTDHTAIELATSTEPDSSATATETEEDDTDFLDNYLPDWPLFTRGMPFNPTKCLPLKIICIVLAVVVLGAYGGIGAVDFIKRPDTRTCIQKTNNTPDGCGQFYYGKNATTDNEQKQMDFYTCIKILIQWCSDAEDYYTAGTLAQVIFAVLSGVLLLAGAICKIGLCALASTPVLGFLSVSVCMLCYLKYNAYQFVSFGETENEDVANIYIVLAFINFFFLAWVGSCAVSLYVMLKVGIASGGLKEPSTAPSSHSSIAPKRSRTSHSNTTHHHSSAIISKPSKVAPEGEGKK